MTPKKPAAPTQMTVQAIKDGTVIDLFPERERMDEEAEKVGEPPENVQAFLAYSERLYDLVPAPRAKGKGGGKSHA